MPATTSELEFHEKRLTQKIVDLKSGALKAEQHKGDGRQDAAIHRAEAQLRDVKKELAAQKKGDK